MECGRPGDGANDAKDNVFLNSTFRVAGGRGVNIESAETNIVRNSTIEVGSTGIAFGARATATVSGNDISRAATVIYVESAGVGVFGNVIHLNGAGVSVNVRGVFGPPGLADANDIHHNTTGINVFSTATGAVIRFKRVRRRPHAARNGVGQGHAPRRAEGRFRQDLAAPYGSAGEFALLGDIGNGSYRTNLDRTMLVTPAGREFLRIKAGAAGAKLADGYQKVLDDIGVKATRS